MNMVNIRQNKNNLVVKHQDMIRRARYSLSELGIKVVSCLIAMIRANDQDFQEYHLRVSDFKELISSNSHDIYAQIDRLTDELMKTPFKIDDMKFNWCYMSKYSRGDATLMMKIAPELRPYLLELQQGNFTQYHLENVLKLKSAYVIRLYELFKDRLSEATRYDKKSATFELKIDELRELFEIPASYQYSSHIKRHIIDKAQKQFKEKTDIQFDYKEQKIGRKVDRLIVTIKENNKGSNDFLASEKAFISHMRKHYVNADIYTAKDKNTSKTLLLSVDQKGKLYNKLDMKEIDKKRSSELWSALYLLAKHDKLFCLKQRTLF